MKKEPMSPEKMSDVVAGLTGEEKGGKFRELIEKNAMDPEKIERLSKLGSTIPERYPELKNIETMTPSEYSTFYKKMAQDILDTPDDFDEHIKVSGMTPEELSDLFKQIAGAVDKYPEIWESRENAQLLRPGNLSMLADALKADTREAIAHIKGNK